MSGLNDRPRTVLFICVGNAGRSLIAEAIFNHAPPPGWRAESGGVRPASQPHDRTGRMLQEIGLELPPHPPQMVSAEAMERAAIRVTMGCLDDASCPARLKTLEVRDWGLPDPANLDDAGFRGVRDQLQLRIDGLRREIELDDLRTAARRPATAP
ncbi:MAG: low molecular weight phosphatase family protein [Thermoplasmata archaeon]|nr:low molecular weight phosphatase family protein [Thermoplasmata archaeon]